MLVIVATSVGRDAFGQGLSASRFVASTRTWTLHRGSSSRVRKNSQVAMAGREMRWQGPGWVGWTGSSLGRCSRRDTVRRDFPGEV